MRPRLFFYNGGFLWQRRVRRILQLSGYDLKLGLPGPEDSVAVWGQGPTAHRGEAIAAKRGVAIVRIEDSFLRSLHPGRRGEPGLGLQIDSSGVHFDGRQPSDLETLLAKHPLDDTALLDRARDCITRLKEAHLTKYAAVDPAIEAPAPGYVLVVDQVRDDASVRASGADAARFREMLVMAQEENPGSRVLIKSHPETPAGYRAGYYSDADCNDRISLMTAPISPWTLLEGAVGVYTVSSQLGFEAILADHKPRIFGQPFYAGWGLTQDEDAPQRRNRSLTRAQLFAAAMILYPKWYDPCRDALCPLEDVITHLESEARAWREDRHGWVASGMRLWKRGHLQTFFGHVQRVDFRNDPSVAQTVAAAKGRPHMCWANKAGDTQAVRVEDGFLRSRGLGAELVPPLSLVADRTGIYYDPSGPSDLEELISQRANLRPAQEQRAERLIAALLASGISKYNLGGDLPDLPEGRKILVPGQVEDDASILLGAGDVRTNRALLEAVRDANPDAIIIYKPHPDVESGLRDGATDASGLADVIAHRADPIALIAHVDELWTMTSLMGFEALLRGTKIHTFGAPFYAGWGLTLDHGPVPDRRRARPGLAGLVHAALIDYPRYRDPISGRPCPPEVVIERLRDGSLPKAGAANRILSKLQGLLASRAHIWR